MWPTVAAVVNDLAGLRAVTRYKVVYSTRSEDSESPGCYRCDVRATAMHRRCGVSPYNQELDFLDSQLSDGDAVAKEMAIKRLNELHFFPVQVSKCDA